MKFRGLSQWVQKVRWTRFWSQLAHKLLLIFHASIVECLWVRENESCKLFGAFWFLARTSGEAKFDKDEESLSSELEGRYVDEPRCWFVDSELRKTK